MSRGMPGRKFRFLALLAVLGPTLVVAGGCVQRRMTIRTNPPGAQVYIDNYEIGRTPVSTDFVYYGKRNIRLVKDGYETVTIPQPINPPWYQLPGIDFFVETLTPWEIRDERNFNYEMQPLMVVPSESLLTRAEELRQSAPAPAATVVAPQPVVSPYAVPGTGPMVQPSLTPMTSPVPQSPGAPQTYAPQTSPYSVDPSNGYGGRPIAPLP
jgi:hypothetical protein